MKHTYSLPCENCGIEHHPMMGCPEKALTSASKPARRAEEDSRSSSGSAADGKLTPEQIAHWRDILCATIGPYALIMPDEQVQQIRDNMQKRYGEPPNAEVSHTAGRTTENV